MRMKNEVKRMKESADLQVSTPVIWVQCIIVTRKGSIDSTNHQTCHSLSSICQIPIWTRKKEAQRGRGADMSFGLYLTMMAQNPRPFCQDRLKLTISLPRPGKPSVRR